MATEIRSHAHFIDLGRKNSRVVSSRVPIDQFRRLQRVAAQGGRTVSDLFRVFARSALASGATDPAGIVAAVTEALGLPAGTPPAAVVEALGALVAALEAQPPAPSAPAPPPPDPLTEGPDPAPVAAFSRMKLGGRDIGPSSIALRAAIDVAAPEPTDVADLTADEQALTARMTLAQVSEFRARRAERKRYAAQLASSRENERTRIAAHEAKIKGK